MPQMYPLMWLILFLASSAALIVSMSITHFYTQQLKKKNSSESKIPMKNLTWKW